MNKFKISIKIKILITILLLTLAPLLFLGLQAFNLQKKVIEEEVTRNHLELSNLLAHAIYEQLENTRKLLNSITELEIIKSFNPMVTADFLQTLIKNYSIFKVLYLVDNNKNIVYSTDPNTKLPPDWSFSSAVKRSYQGSLSDVNKTADGIPYVTLEALVRSPDRGIIGVLIAEIDLQYIHEILKSSLKRSKSQGIVLDENGSVIALSSADAKVVKISSLETIDNDVTAIKELEKEKYLITAVSLKKFNFYQAPNWTIVLQIPEQIAFSVAYDLRDKIFTLLITTIIISVLLALLMANSFISPLMKLITSARYISNGDFSHPINLKRSDEIGELANTFEEMRVNLKRTREDLNRRIYELDILYKVGQDISSILDFNLLQHNILEKVVKVLSAEKGSLMLLDEYERVLTIGVAIGLSEEIQKETKISSGENISGFVLETQKPLFIEDVETDQAFKVLKKTNLKKGTLMSAPLIAKDKVLGVLNVSKSIPYSFSYRDFQLFQNLATQASIAIENARLYKYAVTDELTKLYNHRYFQQRLDEEIQRADRYDSKLALILLDVDYFKKFNDTYGHQEGDRVLKTVSRIIETNIREVDIPARYGGEEFAIICPEKDAEGALVPAQRVRNAVENFEFKINGVRVPLTISVGVASYPDQAKNKFDLILYADTALYYSKVSGRNRVTLYNSSMKIEEVLAKGKKN